MKKTSGNVWIGILSTSGGIPFIISVEIKLL